MNVSIYPPGRSATYAGTAMVATAHPLATAAGVDVIRSGGNAVDAAVCAAALLAVVEPGMSGLGGDCFALVAATRPCLATRSQRVGDVPAGRAPAHSW